MYVVSCPGPSITTAGTDLNISSASDANYELLVTGYGLLKQEMPWVKR
jgi:hypothetical protein